MTQCCLHGFSTLYSTCCRCSWKSKTKFLSFVLCQSQGFDIFAVIWFYSDFPFFFFFIKHAELPKSSPGLPKGPISLLRIFYFFEMTVWRTPWFLELLSEHFTYKPFCALSILTQFIGNFNLTQMFADRNFTGDDKIPLTQCAWC